MDIGLIGIVSLVVFASTAFQAVAGFGYAIVAAPVLVPFLGVKETVVFLLVSSVYMRIYMLYSVRKDMVQSWRINCSEPVFRLLPLL